MYQAAGTNHEEYGVTRAVGGVLHHLPGNIVHPIIFASQATGHVLGEVKNQFVPEAKKKFLRNGRPINNAIVTLIYAKI